MLYDLKSFKSLWYVYFLNFHAAIVLYLPNMLSINTVIVCNWQLSVRNCFIRGSVVRYVQLPPEGVDIDLLHDATRREARGG